MSSYKNKLLRVDLSRGEIKVEPISEWLQRKFLGPRGFGIKYLYDELKPGIEPLSADNKLVMGVGVLGGTMGQGFSKWLVMTKSPLSGGIGRSVCGGDFGAYLKFAGFDLIIIEGKAASPCYIYIEDGGAEVVDGVELWGLNTEETQAKLRQKHGPRTVVACIGPAGEKLVRYASIVSDRRTAARCGVGTVMGAKNLKAIAIIGTGKVIPYEPKVFKELSQKLVEIQKLNKRRIRLTEFGTASAVENYAHLLNMTPVRNFREGVLEGIERLFPSEFNKFKVKNYSCWGCMTRCGKVRQVTEGSYSGFLTEGPEYETIFSFGAELANTNPAAIIAADSLCDLLGMDTISTGVSIGFACELFERGIVTTKDTCGLELTWGNHPAFIALVSKIGKRQGFGKLLGEGVKRAAERIGRGAEKYAMHVKGLEMPGYEPRAVKGYGLSYAVSNIGASHMYGRPTQELVGEIDPLVDEGKGEYISSVQKEQAVRDCILECVFGDSGLTPELRNRMLVAATGFNELGEPGQLEKIGERIVTLERAFNVREGFDRQDDTLPSRFLSEPLENAGPATGQIVRKLDVLLDEYYTAIGYTLQGIPTVEKLRELQLNGVAKDIAKLSRDRLTQ
jgi:aldehyde:ferredoxin oxidoreductase